MMRPEWISACVLDAPDESEAQLTALDLAARPPAKLGVIKCLLACGAKPTSRVVQKLLRNCSSGGKAVAGGGMAAVRECFLGAIVASNWARNPLIPGLNLYVAIIAARRTVRYVEVLVMVYITGEKRFAGVAREVDFAERRGFDRVRFRNFGRLACHSSA